jgi:hypothetical protein
MKIRTLKKLINTELKSIIPNSTIRIMEQRVREQTTQKKGRT